MASKGLALSQIFFQLNPGMVLGLALGHMAVYLVERVFKKHTTQYTHDMTSFPLLFFLLVSSPSGGQLSPLSPFYTAVFLTLKAPLSPLSACILDKE